MKVTAYETHITYIDLSHKTGNPILVYYVFISDRCESSHGIVCELFYNIILKLIIILINMLLSGKIYLIIPF